jgi:hypothetical protein
VVRPYGALLFYEGRIYIMAFGQTAATLQLAANPRAEICAFKGKTLRVACRLVEDARPEVAQALVDKMPVLKPALGERGERGVMYYLADARPSSSDDGTGGDDSFLRLFGGAAAGGGMAAGLPPAGEKGRGCGAGRAPHPSIHAWKQ